VWPNGKAPRLGRGDWEFESLHLDQFNAGIAQMVEQWFCKPQVAGSIPAAGTRIERAWYNGIMTAFQADDTGSIPVARSRILLPYTGP
jgi:hypothetical protein